MSTYFATGSVTGTVAAQNLVSIENPVGSGLLVCVDRARVRVVPGVLVATAYQYQFARTTGLPTGATTITAAKISSAMPVATAIVRSAPTATAAGGSPLGQCPSSLFLGAAVSGFVPIGQSDLWESSDPAIIAPGEALVVLATGNLTTLTHFPLLGWREVSQ